MNLKGNQTSLYKFQFSPSNVKCVTAVHKVTKKLIMLVDVLIRDKISMT